jgi:hypothetical protein
MTDLFNPQWTLQALKPAELGPYSPPLLSDEEKQRVWDHYRRGKPFRVPVIVSTNNRAALLDQRISHGGLTFRQVFSDAKAMLQSKLLWAYVCTMRYNHFQDAPTGLPDAWHVSVDFQNVYEAWFFGCPVRYYDDQVPDTTPILGDENKRGVFEIDIDRPLDRPPFQTAVAFHEALAGYVGDKTFLDRPIVVDPPGYVGTDGPLTVAMNVRGPGILVDLMADPEYAHALFAFFIEAALKRRRAFIKCFNMPDNPSWFADDSIALLGVEQYKEMLLPHHRRWYEGVGAPFGRRAIHLCGDATRHFPTLKDELGVTSFDTGFPVDFARLRETLGPDVEILGGVEVRLLATGTAAQVYARSREILTSGIMNGGRFVFREANNLPPNVSWENLAALYKGAFDFGRYDGG